jgi:hypothetical protein
MPWQGRGWLPQEMEIKEGSFWHSKKMFRQARDVIPYLVLKIIRQNK